MLKKLHELFNEYREEYGVLTARKMAQKECISEMVDDLCTDIELSTDEKVDKIIAILELMNLKVD